MLYALIACPCRALAEADVRLSHQAWSTEEGLPQASVHQVFQSRDGYLWLATEGGAVRFDGTAFKTYSHEADPAFLSDDIRAIAQDATGALWFGTSDGLVQDRDSALRRFTVGDGLPSTDILSVAAASDGSLLVLTAKGLVRYDGSAFHVLASSKPVESLQPDVDGTILMPAQGEVLRYDHGAITAVNLPVSSQEAVLSVQTGPDHAVWVRTALTVTLSAPGLLRVWHTGTHTGTDLPGSRVQALSVSRDGTAWIGTNRGLFTVGAELGSRVEPVTALGAEPVLCVTQDREGNEWAGTETSGLHVLRPRKFWSEAWAGGDSVTAVVQATDGAAWFGTRDQGLHQSSAGTDVPVPPSMLTSSVILALAPGLHGDVWAGTPDGLNHIEPGPKPVPKTGHEPGNPPMVHRYTSADGLPDDFVRSVLVSTHDSAGSVWVGTRHGLAHLQNGTITTLTAEDGLASDSVGALFESRNGDIWIGTSGGLSRLRGGTLQSFTAAQGLPGTIVTAITQDTGGGIWVGVHGAGLSRFDGSRFAPIRCLDLPLEIHALAADAAGFLWLRADHGVYRVPLAQLNGCAGAGRCALTADHYGVPDGMPSDELSAQGSPSIWQAADGKLWFATRKGLAVADPLHMPMDTVPPPVVIEQFAVDDAGRRLTPASMNIAAGHRRYSFSYVGLSYTAPSKTRYRYMLEGFDRDWVDAGTRRTAYYTSLPPHAYRFLVMAQNNDGVWSTVAAQVRFTVLPPFYLQWWFYALVLIAAVSTAALLLQLRVRRLQRQFDMVLGERNRMAREIHDTLAQDFVGASLQLEILRQLLNANKLPQAKQQIEETRLYIKNGLEAARQSIWNLRANAAAGSLPSRLTAVVERYARTQAIQAAPKLKIGGAFRALPVAIENEVTRIAEESLSNVARHAAATHVAVELLYGRDTLLLTVEDNGKGFVETAAREAQGHYGLLGMSERAATLGARLAIASREGEGTTVTLTVPLPAAREGQAA